MRYIAAESHDWQVFGIDHGQTWRSLGAFPQVAQVRTSPTYLCDDRPPFA